MKTLLYKIYAENVDGKMRYLGKAWADRAGLGLFDLYADECEEDEQVVIKEVDETGYPANNINGR